MYEFLQHTADAGLRVEATTLEALFADAGRGLFSLMVSDARAVHANRTVSFEIGASALDELLYDWLNELVYIFETQSLVLSGFEVVIEGTALRAKAEAAPLDAERHGLGNEIKAVTYHGLRVKQEKGRWMAEVIVDI